MELTEGGKLTEPSCANLHIDMPATSGRRTALQADETLAKVCSEQEVQLRDASLKADLRKVHSITSSCHDTFQGGVQHEGDDISRLDRVKRL